MEDKHFRKCFVCPKYRLYFNYFALQMILLLNYLLTLHKHDASLEKMNKTIFCLIERRILFEHFLLNKV